MNRRSLLALLSAGPLACAAAKPSGIRKKFLGVWALVSCESKNSATGAVTYLYGEKPVGRITYDTAGRMSALLMRPGRTAVANTRAASADELRGVLIGFTSYMGTFDVDEASSTVIHHVQAALTPSWVGTDLRRRYEFSGPRRLTLTAGGAQAVTQLVWERALD